MSIYITGDTHGDFRRVAAFCDKVKSTKDDVLIILGDAGINYYGKAVMTAGGWAEPDMKAAKCMKVA